MPMKQRFDRFLLGATVLQTAVGLALLGSASWLIAIERYHRPGSYFFTWQTATAVIGLGLLVVCMYIRLQMLTDLRLATAGLVLSWLLVIAAFLQSPVANTHRWLIIGGFSLQPSVLARVGLIFVASALLARAQREEWPVSRLAAIAAAGVVTAGLVMAGPDLGSAALIAVVLAGMAFVAGMPLRHFTLPAVICGVGLVAAIVSSPYRLERIRAFIDGGGGSAAGFQSQQSLVALGSGGLFGKGYGDGLQKLFFLPEPHTDFIFAITGEELGLLGVLALIALAAIITWRGLRIAYRQSDRQRALLAFGLILAFAIQSLIHMVVCLDLLPPKGIPLPLVSYGKTDLLVTLGSMGLLLNLSREVGT
jgi:cell division protein FtsW